MADRKISDLTALTTPASGDYLPIVDISEAAAASKNKRITIEELMRGVPDGTAAAPGIAFETDPNTGIYRPGADQLAVATNGTGRLFVDSAGNVGIGNATGLGGTLGVSGNISLSGNGTGSRYAGLLNENAAYAGSFVLQAGGGSASYGGAVTMYGNSHATYPGSVYIGTSASSGGSIIFGTEDAVTPSNEKVRLDASGRLGIGSSAPGTNLHIGSGSGAGLGVLLSRGATTNFFEAHDGTKTFIGGTDNTNAFVKVGSLSNHPVAIIQANGSAIYIDTSKRVGIGTTSPDAKLLVSDGTNINTRIGQLSLDNFTGEGAGIRFSRTTSDDSLCALGTLNAGAGDLGLFSRTNLIFATGGAINYSSATERARIDSSGRLLVGTSTARSNIQFGGGSAAAPTVQIETAVGSRETGLSVINNSSGGFGGLIRVGSSAGATVGSNDLVGSGTYYGILSFVANDGTNFVEGARISAVVDGTSSTGDLPTRLEFSTTADGASSPTERMRIASGGNTDVFSDNDTLASRTSVAAGTTRSTFVGFHSATSTQNGTISCRIWSNGNVQNTNGSYTTLSDAKLKENIVDAGSQWDDLKAIQIRNWNFKAETGHETHRQIGPIAQELETVCPGLVFETPDRDADGNETGEVTKGVNQSVLYMKAVKALQEAMERIETLEANNTDLLARVTALESA